MVLLRAMFIVLCAALAFSCKQPKKTPSLLEGGEISYAVSGIARGKVSYGPGVRREDAGAVGDWLREKGWFVTRDEQRSALSGRAQGTYGAGAPGRGRGEPLAKVA